jgi:hypothetical protein
VPDGPLNSAVTAAIAAWRPALTQRGINMSFKIEACNISDPRCVRVNQESAGANNCATTTVPGVTAAGYPAASPLAKVTQPYDQPYLNFLLTHELGHLLGLFDSNCPVDKTIMSNVGHQNCG